VDFEWQTRPRPRVDVTAPPRSTPTPDVRVPLPGVPFSPLLPRSPTASPLTPFQPGTLALPSPFPVPKEDLDEDCKCKKKPSKPRKPRTECWKGSYIETAKGTIKHRRERTTC